MSLNRRKPNRLVLVLFGAILLVTLPVLPLRFLGIPGPDFSPDLNHVAQLGRDLLNKFNPRTFLAPPPAESSKVTSAENSNSQADDDVSLLDQAEQQLLNHVVRNPQDPSPYNQLGLIYAGSGEYDKAVSYLQKAIEVSRARVIQLTASEQQLRAQGNAARATQALLERSRISVELSAAHSSLARVYDQLGQHDRVVAQLEQLNTDIAFGGTQPAPIRAATATTTNGIGAASAAGHKMSLPVLRLLARGEALMQERDIAQATQTYKQVVQLDPMVALAHERLGTIAALSNNYYLAVQELETAVHLDPNNGAVHTALAAAYQAQGEPELAIEHYEKALALNPRSADAALNLGNILCTTGKYKPAEEAFEKLTKITPESAMAHNSLATVRSMAGNYKGAIGEYEKSLTIQPDIASSHYGLGLAYFHNTNYPASIREFKRALTLDPGLTDAQAKMQLAYKKSGLPLSNGYRIN
jgi:tetratricopeptide (TPR) repeat protein